MPRNRMMDMMMSRDSRRMSRYSQRDRGMNYGYNGHTGVRMGERYPMDGNYSNSQYNDERSRRDYESGRQYDMGYDYPRMNDGHYGAEGKTYYPIEAMGTFNGYWGRPQEDYGRYGRDMRYDYAGDYGEKLTQEELEHWRKKLDKEVGDEQSKHFFKKENIEQKARQMGLEMKHFNAEELAIASYMLYSDYCKSLKPYVGQNMDVFVKMGEEFLTDPDSAVKGGEKLALYFEIVAGEDD